MRENDYGEKVFLSHLLSRGDYREQKVWAFHQKSQFDYLIKQGLKDTSVVLDIGCGPLRLGVKLIPYLQHGFYYGEDINAETIALGKDVLRREGIQAGNYRLMVSTEFDFTDVDHAVDFAFSNSLFSHLGINSILQCLLRLRQKLANYGVYYSSYFSVPNEEAWCAAMPRNKWGKQFATYPNHDPYHYTEAMFTAIAEMAGYRFELDAAYNHPTQTMGVFRPLRER